MAEKRKREEVEDPVPLDVDPAKVCFIIIKAREFDVKVEPVEPNPASNPADMQQREILEDYASDPTFIELRDAINGLNEDETVELVALAWLGRGDFDRAEWNEVLSLAAEPHQRFPAMYLMGLPLLGDYLENGLSELGYSCEAYEIGRL